MNHKVILFLLATLVLICSHLAQAQQPTKIFGMGFLTGGGHDSGRNEAFRQGLRELGYVEGRNIVIQWRAAERKPGGLAALATELVRLKVDVIVVTGLGDLRAAKEATATIPIVMVVDSDPVRSGFIASLARPGGNITGLSTLAPGRFWDFNQCGHRARVNRGRTRRRRIWDKASIPGRARSKGFGDRIPSGS